MPSWDFGRATTGLAELSARRLPQPNQCDDIGLEKRRRRYGRNDNVASIKNGKGTGIGAIGAAAPTHRMGRTVIQLQITSKANAEYAAMKTHGSA